MFCNNNPSQKRRAQPSLLAYMAYLSHIPSRNIILLLHEKKEPCSSQSNSAVDNNTELC